MMGNALKINDEALVWVIYGEDIEIIKELFDHVGTGRPLGDEDFYKQLARAFYRELQEATKEG